MRSRGTIGGSIARADPAADLAGVLLAMDATVVARGLGGEREIPIADFFVDFWETALDPMEVLIEIRVPNKSGSPFSFHKFRQRSQDWAIVGVAAVGGRDPRVALMNMAMTPMRAHGVEQALASGATPAEAAAHAD